MPPAPVLETLSSNSIMGNFSNNECNQPDVNSVAIKQEVNENVIQSSQDEQEKENNISDKLSGKDKASTIDSQINSGSNQEINPKPNEPQEVIKANNDMPKTPLLNSSLNLASCSQIKDSPNSSMQLTDKMIEEEELYKKEEQERMEKVKAEALDELERTGKQERFERLQNLLSKSQTYSTYLLGRINDRHEKEKKAAEREEKRKLNEEQRKKEKEEKQKSLGEQNQRDVRGRHAKVAEENDINNSVSKKKKRKSETEQKGQKAKRQRGGRKSNKEDFDETFEEVENEVESSQSDETVRTINGEKVPDVQPKLLTGGVMRQYQIEGMEWLVGLFENGINGILADEMGLGKTLQSIALITNLIEQKVIGPFMIAAPLSTLPNWVAEFKRFAPQVYTILYHGSKEERAEKRRKMMRIKKYSHGLCSLPVVITSYEIVMRDRPLLSAFKVEWKYLIVDEGHRLKNLNCKLIKEMKLYNTGNRLLLTGTPLQNDLAELWSLLNFLLPDIFDDLSSFQKWFDFSAMSSSDFIADEQETSVLQTLHSILTPFLLRRLKTDVDLSIPPKKEVLVRCPMTLQQQNYYKTTLDKSVLDMIAKKNDADIVVQDPYRNRCSQIAIVQNKSLPKNLDITLTEKVDLMINGELTPKSAISQLKNTENDPHLNSPLQNYKSTSIYDSDTDATAIYPLDDAYNPLEDLDLFESPILEELDTTQEYFIDNQRSLSNNSSNQGQALKATTTLATIAMKDPITTKEPSKTQVESGVDVTSQRKEGGKNVCNNTQPEKMKEVECSNSTAEGTGKLETDSKDDANELFAKIMKAMAESITDPLAREMAKIECQQIMLKHRFGGKTD